MLRLVTVCRQAKAFIFYSGHPDVYTAIIIIIMIWFITNYKLAPKGELHCVYKIKYHVKGLQILLLLGLGIYNNAKIIYIHVHACMQCM